MSTLQHWCDEILQWLPSFRFLVYRGNASQLAAVEKERMEKWGMEFWKVCERFSWSHPHQETVSAGNKVNIVLTNYEVVKGVSETLDLKSTCFNPNSENSQMTYIIDFPVSSLSSSSLRPWQATKRFLEIFHGTAGSPSFLKPLKGVLSILCWISWCWIQVCWFFLLRSHSRWRASHQKLQGSQQPGLRNFHLELIWREQQGWSMARSYGVYLVDIACCWLARQDGLFEFLAAKPSGYMKVYNISFNLWFL